MTPEPTASVSRSTGWSRRLKNWRNSGSCANGLTSLTSLRTETPTTPGVIRLTTPATLVTAVPPTSGIGAPANAGKTAPAPATIPPDTTHAAKSRFMPRKPQGRKKIPRRGPPLRCGNAARAVWFRELSSPSRERFKKLATKLLRSGVSGHRLSGPRRRSSRTRESVPVNASDARRGAAQTGWRRLPAAISNIPPAPRTGSRPAARF